MNAVDVDAVVRAWLDPLEVELDAIFGPSQSLRRAQQLNRLYVQPVTTPFFRP
jgi:hypothetical protein